MRFKKASLLRSITISDMCVGNQPGAMAFTLILCPAHLHAKSFVKMITPPLLAW